MFELLSKLVRFLSGERRILKFTSTELIYGKLSFSWGKLEAVPKLTSGFLFWTLSWDHHCRSHKVKWLSAKQAAEALQACGPNWCACRSSRLVPLHAELDRILDHGYLREGQWKGIKSKAAGEIRTWPDDLDKRWLSQTDKDALAALTKLAKWSIYDFSKHQRRFVEKEKVHFASFFNEVESAPLTVSQREACIKDEVSNLVLAGAGTGKTSMLVGRVGYLLESKRAAPREILLLAYGRKAAEGMDERIADQLKTEDVQATTFHALGLSIIAQVEGKKPSVNRLALDEALRQRWTQDQFDRLLEQPEYRELALTYFSAFLHPTKSRFDFTTEGEYLEFIKANKIRTLKGELVKGYGELLIANRLFRLGVKYEYERRYEVRTATLEFRDYHPDFYLPDYGIYIEHWGFDLDENTAPGVDKNAYFEGMAWKLKIHAKNKTTLIETSYAEHQKSELLKLLEERLLSHDVEFNPIDPEKMLDQLRKFGAISDLAHVLSDLIPLSKAKRTEDSAPSAADVPAKHDGQLEAALLLLKPIMGAYETELAKDGDIDFEDMIEKSISHIKSGRYRPTWRFIMVDEFQDISRGRALLARALRDAVPDASLLGVGDDWQAIYRFSGSDVSLTKGFTEFFGPTAETCLGLTFRFNNSICDIATRFVSKNPSQLYKQIETHSRVAEPAVSLLQNSESERGIELALEAISRRVDEQASVFLLARYNFLLPDVGVLRGYKDKYPKLQITSRTVHSSKGGEADFVVILGLISGNYGFPSEKVSHPLLEAMLPELEDFPHAEERRLFYVALTRARDRAYLLCDMTTANSFVEELTDGTYAIELEEFGVSMAQRVGANLKCSACKTGAMIMRGSDSNKFMGCANYPLCSNIENTCPKCATPMKTEELVKTCLASDCNHRLRLCPKCGGTLVRRDGPRGPFWGCSNYRGRETPSCQFIENA
jgi:DNA helicase-4